MRLVAFDYFRGVAILFIVATHCYGPWAINGFGERVLANLISNGTVLFVFISGFFFHYAFYKNFNFKGFLKKRAKKVLIPYLVLTLLGLFYYVLSSEPLPFAEELRIDRLDSWTKYVQIAAIYLWTGGVVTAYWYIPFILIIFTMSPLFVRYIKFPAAYRNIVFLTLLISAMFIHRPADNLSPLHSILYFLPIYMLGIICSIHREPVMEFIKGKSKVIGLAVLFLAVAQALFYKGYGSLGKEAIFSYGGIDINIVQKVAMCFFFLSVLQKYENSSLPVLKLLASSSFAIYFIHPWVLEVISETRILSVVEFVPGLGVFIMTTPLVLISSVLVAYIVRLGLKKNSRYLIGW